MSGFLPFAFKVVKAAHFRQSVQRLVVAHNAAARSHDADACKARYGSMQGRQHVGRARTKQGVILAAKQGLVYGIFAIGLGIAHYFRVQLPTGQHDLRPQTAARDLTRSAQLARKAKQPGQITHDAVRNIHERRRPGR